jgi:hypothetical protein
MGKKNAIILMILVGGGFALAAIVSFLIPYLR